MALLPDGICLLRSVYLTPKHRTVGVVDNRQFLYSIALIYLHFSSCIALAADFASFATDGLMLEYLGDSMESTFWFRRADNRS